MQQKKPTLWTSFCKNEQIEKFGRLPEWTGENKELWLAFFHTHMGFGSKQESHINRSVTLKLQDDYIENASAEIMSMGNLVVFSFLVH